MEKKIIASLSVGRLFPNMVFVPKPRDLIAAICIKDKRECLDNTGYHDFSLASDDEGNTIVNNPLTSFWSDCGTCPRNK